MLELGLEEAVIDSIVLIEWPERMGPYLPHDRLDIVFEIGGDGEARHVRLRAGPAWRDRLTGIVADA